jgi:predicted nucleic acid-binding protein
MKHIFLDTNVVLDFLLKRQPFAKDAATIFELGKRKKLKLSVSSLSINNIDYVISKLESRAKSRKIISQLIHLVEIQPVGKSTVEKATQSEFKDFEDALQNYCAEEAKVSTIVTRNVKDYNKSDLAILTPIELLSVVSQE